MQRTHACSEICVAMAIASRRVTRGLHGIEPGGTTQHNKAMHLLNLL